MMDHPDLIVSMQPSSRRFGDKHPYQIIMRAEFRRANGETYILESGSEKIVNGWYNLAATQRAF